MKKLVFIILIFCVTLSIEAQNTKGYAIIRSNLGTSGSSKVLAAKNSKYFVTQSIGQSSVIGTYSNNGYTLRQGYQQPLNKIRVVNESFKNNNLVATVHPNPFEQSVFISFTETMEQDILVSVFDVSGKQIYLRKFTPSQRLELNLKDLPIGTYLLKAISDGKLLNSKLIKK